MQRLEPRLAATPTTDTRRVGVVVVPCVCLNICIGNLRAHRAYTTAGGKTICVQCNIGKTAKTIQKHPHTQRRRRRRQGENSAHERFTCDACLAHTHARTHDQTHHRMRMRQVKVFVQHAAAGFVAAHTHTRHMVVRARAVCGVCLYRTTLFGLTGS